MKITLIGYGKMCQTIHLLLKKMSDVEVVTIVDPNNPAATHKEIPTDVLPDVYIDFTHPTVVVETIKKILAFNPNAKIVVGTTGWYTQLDEIKNLINQNPNSALIYSGNFSIGVHMFWKIIEKAARAFNNFSDAYDVFGHEYHHKMKADSPSGTAKTTAEKILQNFTAKKKINYALQETQIDAETLHFSSTRGGSVTGTHSVFFDSEADTVEITHTARNRNGFALGAIKSAFWLVGKKGFFTIENYLNETYHD